MKHNAKSMSKLVSGNSAWRCLSWWSEAGWDGTGGFRISIEHVCLQGKKIFDPGFNSFKITGVKAVRSHLRSHDGRKLYMWTSRQWKPGATYFLSAGSLEGTACFSKHKQAKRFAAEQMANPDLDIIKECLSRLDYEYITVDGQGYVDATSRNNSYYEEEDPSEYSKPRTSRWCYFENGQQVDLDTLDKIEKHLKQRGLESDIQWYNLLVEYGRSHLSSISKEQYDSTAKRYLEAMAYLGRTPAEIPPFPGKEEVTLG
jgi:hypothetical protein